MGVRGLGVRGLGVWGFGGGGGGVKKSYREGEGFRT